MIKGSTVIMSEEYIDELVRHKNIFEEKLKLEDIPDKKEVLKQRIEFFKNKINEAEEFQDTIEEVINYEIPSMALIKTVTGIVIPVSNVKVL